MGTEVLYNICLLLDLVPVFKTNCVRKSGTACHITCDRCPLRSDLRTLSVNMTDCITTSTKLHGIKFPFRVLNSQVLMIVQFYIS